jgi:hypothetical protein
MVDLQVVFPAWVCGSVGVVARFGFVGVGVDVDVWVCWCCCRIWVY